MSEQPPISACNIIGTVLVSAFGDDVDNAIAAARCGFSRISELDFPVFDAENEQIDLQGYQAPHLAKGFSGDIRLAALLGSALKKLQSGMLARPELQGKSLGLYLVLPGAMRPYTGLEEISDEFVRSELEENRPQNEVDDPTRGHFILDKALTLTGCELPLQEVQFFTDTDGPVNAVSAASQAIELGSTDVAIVGAVDSLLDEDTLKWLNGLGLLKLPADNGGIVPGEAAAMLCLSNTGLTREDEADANITMILDVAFSDQFSTKDNPAHIGANIQAVASRLAQGPGDLKWIVYDHDSSESNARDYGTALSRLTGEYGALGTETWYPSIYFGDTGLSNLFVAGIWISKAIERGYAPAATGIALSASSFCACAAKFSQG